MSARQDEVVSGHGAVASAVELMETWVADGPSSAEKALKAARDAEDPDTLVVGLVNLVGCLLTLREQEQRAAPEDTLDYVLSWPWPR